MILTVSGNSRRSIQYRGSPSSSSGTQKRPESGSTVASRCTPRRRQAVRLSVPEYKGSSGFRMTAQYGSPRMSRPRLHSGYHRAARFHRNLRASRERKLSIRSDLAGSRQSPETRIQPSRLRSREYRGLVSRESPGPVRPPIRAAEPASDPTSEPA